MEKEIANTLKNHGYSLIENIGTGHSACCYKIYSSKYSLNFVCKVISSTSTKQQYENYMNEVNSLSLIICKNIISIYEHFQEGKYSYLILEYCQKSVQQVVETKALYPDYFIRNLILDILNAVFVCHQSGIAHLDIKPQNILVDKYGRAKLIDFEFSEIVSPNKKYNKKCGTFAYMPPEMFKGKYYDPFKADIWALGITMLYMIKGSLPNTVLSFKDYWTGVRKLCDDIGPIGDIIKRCIEENPKDRPNIKEVIDSIQVLYKKMSNFEKSNSLALFTKTHILKKRSSCRMTKTKARSNTFI